MVESYVKMAKIVGIVEQKDATPEQLKIQEINTGVLVSDGAKFQKMVSAFR